MLESEDADQNVWKGPISFDGTVDIDACKSFYRLWSAIQYTSLITAATRGQDQITL